MKKTQSPRPKSALVPDLELWEQVKQAVEPLKRKAAKSTERVHEGKAPGVRHSASHRHVSPPRRVALEEPPQLTGLDRRTAQRLMRGQLQFEAKLDLHGVGVEEARLRLENFLRAARAAGLRLVLVVTGKGASPYARHTLHGDSHYHVPERQGRLRKLVSGWMHEPEFRRHVSGFQPAHPKHGGGGAYYVRLRRSGVRTR
jgi:DNA-nicking Smr family endonuclease